MRWNLLKPTLAPPSIIWPAGLLAYLGIASLTSWLLTVPRGLGGAYRLWQVESAASTFVIQYFGGAAVVFVLSVSAIACAIGLGRRSTVAWYAAVAFLAIPLLAVMPYADVAKTNMLGFTGFLFLLAAVLFLPRAREHCRVDHAWAKVVGVPIVLGIVGAGLLGLLYEFFVSIPERLEPFR